jgi:hypothetical protein
MMFVCMSNPWQLVCRLLLRIRCIILRICRGYFLFLSSIKLTCLEVSEFPCFTDHVCFLDFECFHRGYSLGLAVGGYIFGTMESSFIPTLNTLNWQLCHIKSLNLLGHSMSAVMLRTALKETNS